MKFSSFLVTVYGLLRHGMFHIYLGVLLVFCCFQVDAKSAPKAIPVIEKNQITKFNGFSIIGSSLQVRSGIATLAGDMQRELSLLTNEKGRKLKLPIMIRLYGELGSKEHKRRVVSEITQFGGKYQLKIHVDLARGVDRKLLRYHIMEMLLYERGLCDGQHVAKGESVMVRPWLILGMLEAVDLKRGRADRRIYQADVPYFEILPLQKVFDTTEVDWKAMIGLRPMVFRAISGGMVNALLRQPGGPDGMSAYLADIATFKGEEEVLMRKHFPSMNKSRNSLEKWIELEMAELSTAIVTQVYSMLETEKRLESILKLRYRDEEQSAVSVGIDEYAKVLKLEKPERLDAVSGAHAELQRLSFRCFPSYRPLLQEYDQILTEIVKGEDKGIQGRLGRLMETRLTFKETGKRVRDYLDWYYITQSRDVSGSFKEYSELERSLRREMMRPRDEDSLQKYLDGVVKMYGEE